MAYDPTIPALENYIGDDIPKIMANFAELAGSRIVEMGSNSNGEYVRWENGLQVCWLTKNFGVSVDSAYGALYISSSQTWIFPAAFVSAPTVSGLGYGGSINAPRWVGVGTGTSATSVTFWIVDAISRSSTEHGARLIAIGWWK